MTERVIVVGSGASGVHFTLSALRKGYRVLMIDVGYRNAQPVNPSDDFASLKRNLADPAEYFLGRNYEALILPGHESEYYGFPPSKTYVFAQPGPFAYRASGFFPLVSFAAGGLAQAWTAGSYPFRDEEMAAFPFGYEGLRPYYEEVARRIGMTGVTDDLARFFPVHGGLREPLKLDEHSELLLAAYQKQRASLNEKLHCFLGRSRLATLSWDENGRKACQYLGRCLWGCPVGSLYTPSLTLEQCRAYPNFEYLPDLYVSHFRFSPGGRVRKLVAVSLANGQAREIDVDTLVLAAGTLSSSAIVLNSIYRDTGQTATLRGLMDNRQVLMPFLNLGMLGRQYNPNSYQFHQLAIGIDGGAPLDYVHGLVTTLKTALIHPVIQSLPFDLGTAVSLFRKMHAALGLVNINFSDTRRDENYLTLDASMSGEPRLAVHYTPEANEAAKLKRTIRIFRKVLWKLGCLAPPPMTHVRPMGASVHYAGTIPMSTSSASFTCSPHCRSHDFENLYFADGTSFPVLPAKNLTFTLMANAVRIAEEAF